MIKICKYCEKSFNAGHSESRKRQRKYCSHNCYVLDYKNKSNVGQFKKGRATWNRGKKGSHFSPQTEFKKGRVSLNKLPVGTITKRKSKNKIIRQFIKINEPNIWIEYAKFVWIQYKGEIPKGFLIHHIDGNPINDVITNLALMTRAGHINIHRPQLLNGKKNMPNKDYPRKN